LLKIVSPLLLSTWLLKALHCLLPYSQAAELTSPLLLTTCSIKPFFITYFHTYMVTFYLIAPPFSVFPITTSPPTCCTLPDVSHTHTHARAHTHTYIQKRILNPLSCPKDGKYSAS
jgi:hypothetical protein